MAKKKAPKYRKAWAVQLTPAEQRSFRYRHPCIIGSKVDAKAMKDSDERLVQIEYRIVKVEG